MKNIARAVFAAILMFLTMPAFGYDIPEKLIFDISWTGIKAGTATQEATSDGTTVRLVSTAKSADWLKVFFPVDDRTESILPKTKGGAHFGPPKIYREIINEGSTHRDKEVRFNHPKKQALVIDHRNKKQTVKEITDTTYDTLSSYYLTRGAKLEPGKSLFFDIFDGKRLWNTEVQVLRREKITTKLGTFNTVVVKPLLQHEGVFNKKGEIHIWLTDDEKHIPVKMQTKVKIGSIVAVLTGGKY